MRRNVLWQLTGFPLGLLACALVGCSTGSFMARRSTSPPAATSRPAAGEAADAQTPGAAAQSAQDYAEQIQQAMKRAAQASAGAANAADTATPNQDAGSGAPATIHWLDTRIVSPAAPTPAPSPAVRAAPPAPATQPAPAALSRDALVTELRRVLSSASDPPMQRALAAAGLSLADPTRQLTAGDLAGLTPGQRDAVLRYQQLIQELGRQLVRSGAKIDAGTFDRLVARDDSAPAADKPLAIRTVQLCRRVRGFGVYDTFPSNTFLAGRDQRMIVYVELAHFTAVHNAPGAAPGTYQVKLRQQVTLYTAADGTEVWRQTPVDIVDESRNRRHDFFVVQLIDLPARLGVGKYMLKVRVSDVHGGSVDEASVPLTLVADQALVSSSGK